MVGREQDLAFLAARWREACAGHGGLLLIEGEAGVGKTRLVEEFGRQVERQDLRVLRGRCYEFERSLPYQPFPDLLRGGLPLMSPRDRAACPPWALAEVARLAPELAETSAASHSSAPAPPATESADPARLFDGVLRFFVTLAAGDPLLIILDDLHWASGSCLQLIHYLTRHITAHPILLVGTFRPEALDPQHPLLTLQQDLRAEDTGTAHSLLPLPRAAVETMVRELSGNAQAAPPLAVRLCLETEGNPFFLIELLRTLFEAGVIRVDQQTWQIDLSRLHQAGWPLPASVEQAIQMRTARLSRSAREALQYAAVLGQEFDFDALERMWGHGEEATLAALDQLLRRRMLLESSGSLSRDYSFTHKLIQEAVVAGLSRRTRRHLHALAAVALEQTYAGQLADVAGELGFHYRQAQEHDPALAGKAVTYLIMAGDRARNVDMLREAIDYYEQALALLRAKPPGEQAARVCMKLGLVHHWLRDFREADAAYREGAALWQRAASQQAAALPPAPHALRMEWPEPVALNLLNNHTTEPGYIIAQLCSGLVEVSAELEVVPAMARSWEILDEGRRYVFHLDEDARWSDGHPLTAADFELAWHLMLAPATAAFLAPDYYIIRGARAYNQGGPDAPAIHATAEHTLEIELEAPATYFLELVSTVVPVPRHCLEAYGQDWLIPPPLVTNGAFSLEHWEHGQSMTLVRNPYCRLPAEGNIERIELAFNPLEDWQGSLARYEADDLDVLDIGAIPTPAAQMVKGRHADEYRSWPSQGLYVLFFDCNRPPLDHPGVRRAFIHAIEREALAYESLGGADSPATGGLVPPSLPGHSPGIGLPYDPALARRLLAEAGYPGGQGLPLLRCGLDHDRATPAIGAYLQQQWATVLGVASQWTDASLAHFEGRAGNDELHATVSGVAWLYIDPDGFMRLVPMTLGHLSHWQDPEYDCLVAESTRTVDRQRRFALLQRADRILMEGAAVVPLVYPRLHLLVKPWVKRFISFADFPPHLRHVVIEQH
jgi:ABC-type oligopeptide transport system substrate-binding subunit